MHSVLHLQADRLIPEEDQTLKEGLVETCSGCLLAHDGGAQLRMICSREMKSIRSRLRKAASGIVYPHAPPTMTSCLTPKVNGIIHSGSV